MSKLKLISVVALVMAVTGTAWAVTVPSLPSGYVYSASRNEDFGATYIVSGLVAGENFNFSTSAIGLGPGGTTSGLLNGVAADRMVTKVSATGAIGAEDNWGIALMYQIAPGALGTPGPGTTVEYAGPIAYDNSAGGQSTWITAMFHSGVDIAVDVIQGSGFNGIPVSQQKETITTTGIKLELYAVDSAVMDLFLAGAAKDSVNLVDYIASSRSALDAYDGWTGNTLPAASQALLLKADSNYGQSTVVVNASGQIVSSSQNASTFYFSVDPLTGLWGPNLDSDLLLTPEGVPSDLWFQYTLDPGARGWQVHSKDIGGAYAVPEPVTILGLILGVSGLGGYIRRRRMAVA